MTTTEPKYTAEQIRSRLGISTWVLHEAASLEREGLQQIAEAGIVTLEIIDKRDDYQEEDPSTMKELLDACREFGLSITSFHSRSINYHELGVDAEIERSKRMIDHMLDVGGRVWGTHVQIEHAETRLGYEALAKFYEGQDLKLVIENGGKQTIQRCIDWIDAIGHPQIGMILDVGHERNAAGQNPMTLPGDPTKILRNIGPRLHHIHLHDFANGADHHAPFDGGIQWAETFRGLCETDYQGAFMFEPRPAPAPQFADTLRAVGTVPDRIAEMM